MRWWPCTLTLGFWLWPSTTGLVSTARAGAACLCCPRPWHDPWLSLGTIPDVLCRERLFELINEKPTCYEIVIGKATGPAPIKPKRSSSLYSDPAPPSRQPPRPSRPVRACLPALLLASCPVLRLMPRCAQAPIRRPRSPDDNDEGLDSDEDEEKDDKYADGEGDPCPNCGRVYRCGVGQNAQAVSIGDAMYRAGTPGADTPDCCRVSDFWIQCDYCNTWYDGKCVGVRHLPPAHGCTCLVKAGVLPI